METEKQRERRERAERKAGRLSSAAAGSFEKAHDATKHIPMGQPILRGHHNEGRHRRAISRSDAAMRKGVDLDRHARTAESSAKNAGRAITSDDPEAVEALEDRIEALEYMRDRAKTINKEFRRSKDAGLELIAELDDGKLKRDATMGLKYHAKPFASYWFQNTGANIRRLKKRLEDIKAAKSQSVSDRVVTYGVGFQIREDVEAMRIRIFFDGKPDAETRTLLKSNGWRWAPSVGAWQRLINDAGRRSAQKIAEVL